MIRVLLTCTVWLAAALAIGQAAPPENPDRGSPAGEARLLRFPTIHGDAIVFGYAGNLYTVSAQGGIARRLTSHEGYEMFPHFSPDGKTLAFTGQYDGNTEIYTIPAEGGSPKRLTFTATLGRDDVSDRMGPNNICLGWTPDGKSVLFRSRMRSFNDFIGQLFTVPVEGGLPEQLPLPRGGLASYSPDGSKLAFNRIFREFRTWKRYRGGLADDVWVYDFATKKTEPIASNEGLDIAPMWARDGIYFLSDRGPEVRMNLYRHDLATRAITRCTEFKDFDVKFPSLGDRAIVFENGGWIYRLDLETQKTEKVHVRILEDEGLARPTLVSVGKDVTSYEVSPDGKRALLGARGEVFTVPASTGPTRNLTRTSGVHERNSKWSPDGKSIAYVSDATGEDEIWLQSPGGTEKAVQLTTGGDVYKYELYWSPDSKKILWTDRQFRLFTIDVASKKANLVREAKVWEIRDAVWSPDSQWIAWSEEQYDGMNRVYLYSLDSKATTPASDPLYAASSPCFSGDGKYLFLASARDFNPVYSRTEWNHAYTDMERVYAVLLSKKTPSPFRPRSDEHGAEADKKDKPKDEKPAEAKPADKKVVIDLAGLPERTLRLAVAPGSYRDLRSVGATVYYIRSSTKAPTSTLCSFDLGTRKETVHGSASGYEISADGKKMLVSADGKYHIIDLPKGSLSLGGSLDVSDMEMHLDRRAEWRQVFDECWRQMRDFFYDPNLHGVDWKAERSRYAPLVAHVGHRYDLTYVIGEMISELNAGHAYVGGGDAPRPRRIPLGLLGAELTRDKATGYYKIGKILKGVAWNPSLRSPLDEPGVDAHEGDFILAVDGKSTKGMTNIYEALVDTVDKQVTLTLNGKAEEKGSREVVVRPIGGTSSLYYHAWVEGNRQYVAGKTDGKVGYLHVPDMMSTGLNEFARQFYPQTTRKAMIIDVRGNGGGNVSPMLIERLRREIAMITIARGSVPRTNPEEMIWGPMCCLMNEFSASDGDIFPYRFREHGLGKLIGKRSWGGVVGIRGSLPLVDGGTLNKPEFSRYDTAGKEWVIEGKGVTPDIVVDNDPAREWSGEDQQLDRAIQQMLDELKTKEKNFPPPPPTPRR